MNRLKIFTPCWGKKHISLFRRCLGLSLSWPRNNASIKNAEWVIACESEEDASAIFPIVKLISPFCSMIAYIHPEISKVDSGMALIDSLVLTIKSCHQEGIPLLMATPDFIFGEGTIDAFKEVGSEAGSCVSIAHMRVLPQILDCLKQPIPNASLITLGLKYAHVTFSECNERFHYGGVRKTEISSKVYAIEHHMPSPFFCNFTQNDIDSFTSIQHGKLPGFGAWDHTWPTHLLNEGRLRLIGSSDAAMMLEVTDPDKNVPPIDDRQHFVNKHLHNRIQKQFISVFRGE